MARVLITDDEMDVREFITEALELAGHDVEEAPDGAVAWKRLNERSFDVLLTDLRMPVMDGMTLLRKVNDAQPEVQVIVMTAHGTVDTAVKAMKLGAIDYLQKPISGLDELRLTVARAAERRALIDARERVERARGDDEVTLTWGAPAMAPVVDALRKVAATNATVLLEGESGTGKEVSARALHRWSQRAQQPFVAVNCAALSASLIESELFGHEKGAFTGASAQRRGRVELADGGTFFLDEVGELALDLQAKLLRVLETRRFERIGGARTIEVDVRWIAATNRDLREMVADGAFRQDLYHRLAVFPIRLPPLRERREDIVPLARQLLIHLGDELGQPDLALHPDASAYLIAQPWSGNARELRNTLERAAIMAGGRELRPQHFLFPGFSVTRSVHATLSGSQTLADVEREAIRATLAAVEGHRRKAAERLGIGERTLYEKIKRYKLT